jgi:hypothetical protein
MKQLDERFLVELLRLRNKVMLVTTTCTKITETFARSVDLLLGLGFQTSDMPKHGPANVDTTYYFADFVIEDYKVPVITPEMRARMFTN